MGVSFKVSKKGTRFCPKPIQFERNSEECCTDYDSTSTILVPPHQSDLTSIPNKLPQDDATEMGEDAAGISGSSSCSGGHITSAENEVSFMLNLYHDGYSVGKPSEVSVQDTPKSLHPYDRTSETLFSAIESGRLPGDILDDIPSKYFDGMLLCEVRDYRKAVSDSERAVCSVDQSPVVNRVNLRMSLENVVKDISLISDSWTYSDLLEVESRIVKAMQPQLCLDPTPMLDRLCGNPVTTKLNLGLCGVRKRRLRKMPEVSIMSNNQAYGKKVCIEKVQEGSNCRSGDSGTLSGDTTTMQVHESINAQHVSNSTLPLKSKSLGPDASTPPLSLLSKHQQGVDPRVMQDHYSGSAMNASGVPPSGREFMVSYTDPISGSMSSLHGKRENQDAPLTPSSKRARQTPVGLDGVQRQHLGSQLDSLSDISWNGPGLHLHADPRGVQYGSTGGQKYQKVLEAVPNQDASVSLFSSDHYGSRYGVKEELIKAEKLDRTEIDRIRNDSNILEAENSHMDTQQSRLQQRLPQHPLMRSHISQMQWHNLGQLVDNDPRKDDQLSKRKPVQSPRVSAVPVVQSPVSSKSGEFSSGSFGQQFNAVASTNTFGSSQKEKTGGISGATVGGPPSVTSSPSDSMQRQHQGTVAMKRRSNSVPRTPAMSGVGSPCSVGNMMVPMNASSPSISTQPLADQMILERFSKIEMVTQRHKLNHKKNKVDEELKDPVRKPMSYSTQLLSSHLSNALINEELKDPDNPNPMSKSLIGGSMNVCKIRALTFLQAERRVQGNVSIVPKARNRLVMSEKQNDGTVAMQYGDIDDNDFQLVEDHMPTLPNTYYADLLGAQFISLMIREGYQHTDDQVRPKPTASLASNTQSNASAVPSSGMTAEMQQYPETNTGQASSAITTSVSSGNASLNTPQSHQTNSWMLPPGSSQALQMSQGFMLGTARPVTPQQLDSQMLLMQQQQQQQLQNQHPQIQQHAQRPSLMSSASPLSHLNAVGQNSNVQLGNHMVSKSSHSPSQLQLLQQQQQQQQQRKMMMGLGPAMNMGNLGNNVVGLGGLGNVLGMGGIRPGISPSMGPISGIGNMGQNTMNPSSINNAINQQLLSGNITHAQATVMASKFKLARANMSRVTQSGITGLTGTGQMHPGSPGFSMLGQTLNRSNINPLQRTNLAAMGPPKMIPGPNFFMNQQQQQLQLQHQQQQLQQQQQHMQQQQQQQISSPLQAVVSSPQVGSPSAMAIPQQITQLQQQISPQQINQQTPMSPRLSSGTLPPLNTTNAGTGPPSPQLSSQTLGSVGSITSSSMELQGVNKSNSMNNV